MESAEGLPANQVAWGRLSGNSGDPQAAQVPRLEVDLAEKTLPIAQQRGSNLLSQVVTTLQDGHKFPGAPNVAEPVRLAILIGHEHNIAHIERLLNLAWEIPGYQANEVSPGSALAFELFREPSTGQRYVRLAFFERPELTEIGDRSQPRPATGCGGGRADGLRRVRARAVVPDGALPRDRQGRHRSGLRDDQALRLECLACWAASLS